MAFIESLKAAVGGLGWVFRSERNARIHVLIAFLALVAGFLLGVSNAELAAIFFAILLVFLAEIVNTAFEKTLDLVDAQHNPKIKIIKDMMAGAVLVAAVGAVIIGLAIFWPYLLGLLWRSR